MPPTGGVGGNAAIRDAASLMENLTRVSEAVDIQAALEVEIPKYEKDMMQFSKSCVNTSMRNVRTITAEGYIFPHLMRTMMRIVNLFIGAPSQKLSSSALSSMYSILNDHINCLRLLSSVERTV